VSLFVDNMEEIRPERLMELAMEPGFRAYEVKGAVPLQGAPEGPDSPYLITLVAHCKTEDEAAKLRAAPAEAVERIKERFGRLDELRIMDVTAVRPAAEGNELVPKAPAATDVFFEAEARPTAAARRLWPHQPSLFFGALPLTFMQELPLGLQLFLLEDKVINGFGAWIAVLLSIIITAFFIPNMLRKGTVDLLLVKPVHRPTLLLYKYVGGLIFILLNTTVAVAGIWAAIGLRSGIWAPGFLLAIPVISAFFAILYAVSTLFAVLTRSPIVAILLTISAWFLLYVVGVTYELGESLRQQEKRRETETLRAEQAGDKAGPAVAEAPGDGKDEDHEPGSPGRRRGRQELPFGSDNWFFKTVGVVHFMLPRTRDLDHLMSQLLIRDLLTANQIKAQKLDDTRISWGESLSVSGFFVAILLGLSCLWFATRDY
jgi:hypothetical protein